MAEPNRIDQDVTTADLAGRAQRTHDADVRPKLLRNDPSAKSELVPTVPSQTRDDAIDRLDSSPSPIPAGGPSVPTTGREPVRVRDDVADNVDQPAPLFAELEGGDFRSRWMGIQTAFVDEPRQAVKDADALVASLMAKLAEGFANERERLERQWDRGDNVSTEDLRVALQRYRSFFDRLLAI